MAGDAQVQPAARSISRNFEIVLFSILLLVVPIAGSIYTRPRLGWLITALSMFVYFLLLGRWICGRPLGILINERNLMSLSRFQMVAWSLLILSAFMTIAMKRVHMLWSLPGAAPLNIQMDWHLWALMGISTTSLVGTPLLLAPKMAKNPSEQSVSKTAAQLAEPEPDIKSNRQGTLYANSRMTDAAFSDMFQGDEIGNTAHIDLAKLQMFYFTIVSLISLAYAIAASLSNIYGIDKFAMPIPPDGLVALLGISHAAYLTNKTADHTPS